MRHGRQHDVEVAKGAHDPRHRFAERRHEPFDLRVSRAGQNEERRLHGGALDRTAEIAETLDQGMPDINAIGAAKPEVRGRFERQQREHAIEYADHGARAARPPGPDGRAHIIGQLRREGAGGGSGARRDG